MGAKRFKYSTDIPPLHRVRMLGKEYTTSDVALLLEKSERWVRDNKDLFIVDDSTRNYKFEQSSVLEFYFKKLLS